jgi:hypothetical protein
VGGWNQSELFTKEKIMNKFYDLSITKLDDGTIELTQQMGIDEPTAIYLHPMQASFITNGSPDQATSERITTLERRLLWMRDRFNECHAELPYDMFERCMETGEFYAWLHASIDVATEYCSDLTLNSNGEVTVSQELGNGSSVAKSEQLDLIS